MEPILKNHVMGGLDCGNNLVTQDPNSYKDMSNTIQDVDGVYRTRNGYQQYGSDIGTDFAPVDLHSYKSGGFGVFLSPEYVMAFGDDSGEAAISLAGSSLLRSQSSKTITFNNYRHSFAELNRCLYFKTYGSHDFLKKFDGIKWHNAGLPQAAINGSATTGTIYCRAMYITADFQGNECVGEYTQRRFTPAAGNITVNPCKDGSNNLPQNPYDGNFLDYGFDDKFIRWTVAPGNVSYNAGSDQLTLTVTQHNVEAGDWMQFYWGGDVAGTSILTGLRFGNKIVGLPSFTFVAMKVVSTTPTSVVFDASFANSLVYVDKLKWDSPSAVTTQGIWDSIWSDVNLTNGATSPISNTWIAIFTSSSATSGYLLKHLVPVAYLATPYSLTVNTAGFNIGQNPFRTIPDDGEGWLQAYSYNTVDIQDVIDDTVVKSIFPREAFMISSYAGLLIAADRNVLNFSDTSYNGSIELYRPAQSFQPGKWEDGYITGVCGGEDHLFISRWQCNYSLTGNLATLNIQVSRYGNSVPGGYHLGMQAVGDAVLFMCPWGIYSSSPTGLEAIGKQVRNFFQKSGEYHYDAVFGYQRIGEVDPGVDLSVCYDYVRGLVLWRAPIGNNMGALVLNLRTGNWHKWAGLKFQDVHFVQGEYYCIAYEDNKIFKEEEDLGTDDGVDTESYLQTPWLVLGEPSIEKMFKQLKVYARSSTVLNVKAFWNWDETTVRMNSDMTIADLANKIRIDANKVQAISLRISPPAGEFMEIEAMEIEYGGIQEGMKK